MEDTIIVDKLSNSDQSGLAEISSKYGWLRSQSARHRKLFVLRYFNMYSVKETARACSMTQTAAATALARLRASLKKYLIERGMFYE